MQASPLQLIPQPLPGNRIVCLLEINKAGIQLGTAGTLPLNRRTQDKSGLGAAAPAAEAKLACRPYPRFLSPSLKAPIQDARKQLGWQGANRDAAVSITHICISSGLWDWGNNAQGPGSWQVAEAGACIEQRCKHWCKLGSHTL